MLVYLDFDGVLHPVGGVTAPFEYMAGFAALLREFEDLQVVIASSWREAFGLDDMRGFFPDDLAHRVVGVTPILDGTRYAEILAYQEQTGNLPFVVCTKYQESAALPELAACKAA